MFVVFLIDLILFFFSSKKFKTFKIVMISPFKASVRAENADLVVEQMAALGIELIVM